MASDSVRGLSFAFTHEQVEGMVRAAVRELVSDSFHADDMREVAQEVAEDMARAMVPADKLAAAVRKHIDAAAKKAVLEAAATLATREVRESLESHLSSALFTSKAMAAAEKAAFAEVERSTQKIRAAAAAALKKRIGEMDRYVQSHVDGIASSWIRDVLDRDIHIDTRAIAVKVQAETVAAYRQAANRVAERAFDQADEHLKPNPKGVK